MGTGRKLFAGLLSGVLAFAFIISGVVKITPRLSVEAHKMMYKDFVKYAKIHPAVKFGYEIDPKKFMPQVGVIEVIAGIFLAIGPRITRLISCLTLASIMVGAMYFVYSSDKPNEEIVVPGVFLFLAFIRLNMFFSPTTTSSTKETKNIKTESKKQK